MSNPDTNKTNIDSFALGIPVSIFFLAITIVIFQFKDSIPFFKLILWGGIPLIILIVTFLTNIVLQYSNCNKINAGRAIVGSLPSFGITYIALFISSITYCRIPIASVFAPLIIGNHVDITKHKSNININSLKNSNLKECCVPKLKLDTIELKYPIITGISYGFYILFASLFGITIGNGLSAVC